MSAPHSYVLASVSGAMVAQRAGGAVLASRDDAATLILRFGSKEAADRARPHWERRLATPLNAEIRR